MGDQMKPTIFAGIEVCFKFKVRSCVCGGGSRSAFVSVVGNVDGLNMRGGYG